MRRRLVLASRRPAFKDARRSPGAGRRPPPRPACPN